MKVKKHWLYRDKQSREDHPPYNTKPKFKITGEKPVFIDKAIFVLTTSNRAACCSLHTIEIPPTEWQVDDAKRLRYSIFQSPTYVDFNKVDVMPIGQAKYKIRNNILNDLCSLPQETIKKIKEKMVKSIEKTTNREKRTYARLSFGAINLPREITEFPEIVDLFGL